LDADQSGWTRIEEQLQSLLDADRGTQQTRIDLLDPPLSAFIRVKTPWLLSLNCDTDPSGWTRIEKPRQTRIDLP
jgi:hypothetical protein